MATARNPTEADMSLALAVKPEAWRREVCSCTTCDSVTCFAIRYHSQQGCTCYTCEHSKTCIFYQNLKTNLNTKPMPMFLTELASKVRKEEDVKPKSLNDDESINVTCSKKCKDCKCKGKVKDTTIKCDEVPVVLPTEQKLVDTGSLECNAKVKDKGKCKNCRCDAKAIKDTSKDKFPKTEEAKPLPEIPSDQNKVDILNDFTEPVVKVKDKSKCKNCKCPSKSSKGDIPKTTAETGEGTCAKDVKKIKKCCTKHGQDRIPDTAADAGVTANVVDTKRCKKCFTKYGKDGLHSITSVANEAICTKDSKKLTKWQCMPSYACTNTQIGEHKKKCKDCKCKSLYACLSHTTDTEKDKAKCKECKCKSAYACFKENEKRNLKDCRCKSAYACLPVTTEGEQMKNKESNFKSSYACLSNVSEKEVKSKECKSKCSHACFKTSLPNTNHEAGETKHVKDTKKCKKCQSKLSKDSFPNTTTSATGEAKVHRRCLLSKCDCLSHAAGKAKVLKDYKSCQGCKCKSIYACMYNANEAWIASDTKKCGKYTAEYSKHINPNMKTEPKESITILDSYHKAKKLNNKICCNSNEDNILRTNNVCKKCTDLEEHKTITTESKDTRESSEKPKDSEKSTESESEQKTNVLEKVRKFLAEKLVGQSTSMPNNIIDSGQLKIEKNVCRDPEVTASIVSLHKASSEAITSEPSIINIVRRYIADKVSNRNITPEAQCEAKPDDVVPFVNRIVITTTTNQKIGKGNTSQDDNIKSVGSEIVYEFVRNTKKTQGQNMYVQHAAEPKNQRDDTSVKLSAQIMNVPYKEYKNSIKRHTTPKETFDVFKKIKDIYNTCTCKVCECIANIVPAVNNESCDCKPCQCDQCRSYKKGYEKYSSNQCGCKPCECIECKMLGTKKQRDFIVAPVGAGSHRYCECSPCGCLECGNYTSQMRSRITHEMATEVQQHLNCHCNECTNEDCEQEGTDTCNCDRHSKVMRKPVQKDTNDYDLRHCTVERSSKKRRHDGNIYNKYDTIAMFATISNVILNGKKTNPIYNKYACKDLSANAIQLSQELASWKIPLQSSNPCDCRPCECFKCRKHYMEGHNPTARLNDRWCEICECIINDISNSKRVIPDCSKDICNCKPCECFDCRKVNIRRKSTEYFGDSYPSSHKATDYSKPCVVTNNNIDGCYYLPSESERFLDIILTDRENKNRLHNKKPAKLNHNKDSENLHMFCAVTQKNFDFKNNKNLNAMLESYKSLANDENKNDVDSRGNQPHISHYENEIFDEEVTTEDSSDASTSEIVHINKSSSTSPKGGSSCNSSGHDNSDYLIKFPRSTVETCIQDVMNLNLHKKIDVVNYLKSSLKNSVSSTASENNRSYNRISFKTRQSFENEGMVRNDTRSSNELCKTSLIDIPCDCENCTEKSPKFRKCTCDCDECSCSGTCLNDDQAVCIRKNETTQAGDSLVDREEYNQNGHCYNTLQTSPLPKIFNPSWHSKGLEVSKDNDSIFFKKANVTFSETIYDKDNSSCLLGGETSEFDSSTKTDAPARDLYFNYRSVQKTLQNAKAFSNELLKILKKYEKANQDFDSVSKKFEKLHISFLNNKTTILNDRTKNASKEPPISEAPSDYLSEKPEERRESLLTVPHAEVSTEYEYNRSAYVPNKSHTEICIGYQRTESMITEPKTEMSSGFENDTIDSLQTTDPCTETDLVVYQPQAPMSTGFGNNLNEPVQNNDLLTVISTDGIPAESVIIEPHAEATQEYEYNVSESLLPTKHPQIETSDLFTKPHAETSRSTDDNFMRGNSNKLIEIISQVGSEIAEKPIIERISITSSALMNDFFINLQTTKNENGKSKTDITDDNKIQTVSRIFEVIEEATAQNTAESDAISKDCKKIANEKMLKLKNKYQKYSQLINRGIMKCQQEVWNKSLNRTLIGMTESQVSLSGLNIGIRNYQKKETDTVKETNNEGSTKKHNNELNTVFISSVELIDDVPSIRIEDHTTVLKKNLFEGKNGISKVKAKANLPEMFNQNLGKGKKFFPHSHRINPSKGQYNISEYDDSGASTSQDKYTKAQLRSKFESMPTVALNRVSEMKTVTAPELASIFATKSFCDDPMKISFQAVKKVSDHTVIVKWKVPPATSDVIGYELLIDGRPTQSILNPLRNLAVVTCLPHSDKVLLTVRTITSKTSACGQYPSTSIVYRPHSK